MGANHLTVVPFFAIASCVTGCVVNEGALNVPIQKELLLNKPWENWKDANTDNYILPGLTFRSDSTIVGSSRGDTVFYFTYELQGRYLIMHDKLGRTEKSLILNMKPNTFTVDHLWMLDGPRTYNRNQFGP